MSGNPVDATKQLASEKVSPNMLSLPQVAEDFGVSERHIRRLVDGGRFPQPVKLGRLVRWPRRALEEWVDDGCPKPSRHCRR